MLSGGGKSSAEGASDVEPGINGRNHSDGPDPRTGMSREGSSDMKGDLGQNRCEAPNPNIGTSMDLQSQAKAPLPDSVPLETEASGVSQDQHDSLNHRNGQAVELSKEEKGGLSKDRGDPYYRNNCTPVGVGATTEGPNHSEGPNPAASIGGPNHSEGPNPTTGIDGPNHGEGPTPPTDTSQEAPLGDNASDHTPVHTNTSSSLEELEPQTTPATKRNKQRNLNNTSIQTPCIGNPNKRNKRAAPPSHRRSKRSRRPTTRYTAYTWTSVPQEGDAVFEEADVTSALTLLSALV